jgi:hypothetical protein
MLYPPLTAHSPLGQVALTVTPQSPLMRGSPLAHGAAVPPLLMLSAKLLLALTTSSEAMGGGVAVAVAKGVSVGVGG